MKYLCFLLFSVLFTYSIAKPVAHTDLKNDYLSFDVNDKLLSAVSDVNEDDYEDVDGDDGDDGDSDEDDDSGSSDFIFALGGEEDLESQYPGGIKLGGLDSIKRLKGLEGLDDLDVLDQFDGELDEEARGPITLPLEDVDEIIEIEIFLFDNDILASEFIDNFNELKK